MICMVRTYRDQAGGPVTVWEVLSLAASHVVTPGGVLTPGVVEIEGERIVAVMPTKGVVPDRVPSTDFSHLRRCIAAGLLVRGPEGGWVATDAGRAAMRGLDVFPWTFRDNPAPHPKASSCSRVGAKLATRRSPRAGKALRACASKPSPHARPQARR